MLVSNLFKYKLTMYGISPSFTSSPPIIFPSSGSFLKTGLAKKKLKFNFLWTSITYVHIYVHTYITVKK